LGGRLGFGAVAILVKMLRGIKGRAQSTTPDRGFLLLRWTRFPHQYFSEQGIARESIARVLEKRIFRLKGKDLLCLVLVTVGAMFVHGYHPWAEDAGLYLPPVEKLLNRNLFPFNAEFFESHAHLSIFPNLIAASVRVTHIPLPYALFFWHLISIFLLLFACWELARKCFVSRTSRYAAVFLVAALLTLPVAGTALYIMDQYVNPRDLAAFVGILAIAKCLDRKYVTTVLLLVFGAAIHPFMSSFAICFCILLFFMEKMERIEPRPTMAVSLLPLGFLVLPSAAYHQAALTHPYHYPMQWQWYEWLGVIGPIVILWWFRRIARSRQMRDLELICRTLVVYETVFMVAGLLISVPARFESLARVQPMRSLYLLYILFVLFSGGLLGEYVLKNRWWRWMALFLPLSAGMFYAQRTLFPASAHIEWPGSTTRNPWVQAFEWARSNTPAGAIFALDPYYTHTPGEDAAGFRAVAQRSKLADRTTDAGAVTMFPPLADEWIEQVQAQSGWQRFQVQDFLRLKTRYGVNWVVLSQPGVSDLQCPYQNQAVKVCSVD
jgi:hypothetical protein